MLFILRQLGPKCHRFFIKSVSFLKYLYVYIHIGFPGGSVVKNLPVKQEIQETWVRFLGWKDPLE